jgi:hypothetical protein
VPACLAPPKDRYNVDAVLAAMARKLPESLRAQYLRTLAEGQQKDKLQLLLGQLKIRSKP